MNKLVTKLAVLILVLIAVQSLAYAAKNGTEVPLDRIVAIVNENVILESELDKKTRIIKQQLHGKVELPPDDIIKKQVLESLVIEKLQLDEANAYGITIDDTLLNEDMQAIAKQNGLTLEGLRQQLLAEGVDYETFRAERKKEMILHRLRQGLINSRIRISDAEIDDYLAAQGGENSSEYLVSHIQFSIPEDAENESVLEIQNKAEAVYKKLLNGEDFAKLAVAESDGRTALEGGDLGWHNLNDLPKRFATELRAMTPDQISKPFRMSNGFHILKLMKTKGVERIIVKQVNARHILMTTDKLNTDEQVRQQMLDIRKEIQNGATFSQLAEKHSKDTGSAANGGVLNWAEPSIYDQQFRQVIENLPVGKISEPFQTKYGWHIVEVLGWRDYDKTADVARNTAAQKLYERKAMVEEDLWVRRLRSEAFVDMRLEQ